MLIGHVLPLSCTGRNLRINSTSTVAPRFATFKSSWFQIAGKMYKIRITDLISEPKKRLRAELDQAGSWRHWGSHSSVASLMAPDQWSVFLYTFSCTISNMMGSNGFKSGEFERHSWAGMNYRVSFSTNLTVVRAQWAFQVLQGSAETIFRRGGKRLHHFAANLFRKWCSAESPEFCRRYIIKTCWYFFWTQYKSM